MLSHGFRFRARSCKVIGSRFPVLVACIETQNKIACSTTKTFDKERITDVNIKRGIHMHEGYVSSYKNMLSTSKSPYSPIQNPCHISAIFSTRHYFCLFQSFFSLKKIFKVTIFITETFGKMTCIFLSTKVPSISLIPKKLENFLLCSVIFCLLLFKIRKYDKIMAITVFDIFMARSLRSLAGVLYGGVRGF